mmetsp:Transcript_21451/g.46598  ORF Transcript_21451/g.46598 Transcript_21451/m.46598 type:complete len:336 (-) Transcript_21451:164-1171(-)
MLRDLVSQARSGGTYAELEAMTAERDFFREKYAEQMNVMKHLNGQLKESQRVINKLRSEILDLEVEKSSLLEQGGTNKAPKQIESSGGSTDTSVTCLTDGDGDESLRSGADNNADCVKVTKSASELANDTVDGDNGTSSTLSNAKENEENESDPADADGPKDDDQSTPGDESAEEDEDEEGEDDSGDEDDQPGDEDDEADKIRANAAKMLLWANYQTSKHTTPNTSYIQESTDDREDDSKSETSGLRSITTLSKGGVSDAIVYSLPTNLDNRQLDDDDSTLGSSFRNHPEPSTPTSKDVGGGRIGKLFNNLRGMIDPESDSEGVSDDESTDNEFH